ncbi:MAG: energy-coupling factor ABC transporter ATP-binding protein [Desulfovibrionaceae bacterium]|nr:energy-coupling factor ABC transporter ATP-binding protein [Desulfovibrionaceae bacterium]
MIQARSLSFSYPEAVRPALDDISFQVEGGNLCMLVGMNGSGKSTLLGILAGLFEPEGGELRVAGISLPDADGRFRGKAALVPQDADLYILGSLVEEDLFLGLDPTDEEKHRRAHDLAGRFGLANLLDRPAHTLSYGQKRKLCLASALASGPELLLLDEPFSGLDHPSSMALREILADNRAAGLTQVIGGHDLDLAADLADYFILLEEGRPARAGKAGEIFPLLPAAGVRPPCWWFNGADKPLWLDR